MHSTPLAKGKDAMKTIAIVSQKGGAGKTTLAVHLAIQAVISDLETVIIDLDPQASTARWGDRRQDKNERPVVISAQASRLAQNKTMAKDAGCQLLILDTAPHADAIALAAAKAADLVIVPTKANIMDLEAACTTIELIGTTQTPYFAVLNDVDPYGTDAEEAAEVLRDFGAAVCPVHFGHREAYKRCVAEGLAAQEYKPGSKAAEEAESVYTHTIQILNTATDQQPDIATNQHAIDATLQHHGDTTPQQGNKLTSQHSTDATSQHVANATS